MAQLPEETITTVLNLQRRLLAIINQAAAIDFLILEQYGETQITIIALDDLQNVHRTGRYLLHKVLHLVAADCRFSTSGCPCYAGIAI